MRLVLLFCLVLAGGLLSQPAVASPATMTTGGATLLAQQNSGDADESELSREEAARRAKEKHGGRVLSVTRDNGGWRVRLLKDGRVRTVSVR